MPSPWLRASLEENQLIFCVSTWHAVPIFPSRANLMHIKANKLNVILWSFGQVQHPMCTGLRNWTEMERHFLIKSREGAVPKWWKNRMGRPLSSSQTHWKKKKDYLNVEQLPQNNFWMLAEDPRHSERQPNLFKIRRKGPHFIFLEVWVFIGKGSCQLKQQQMKSE